MLRQVAEGVLVHESDFLQSNAVVVQGEAGILLVDPGIRRDELANLASDIRESGQPVVVGFSTHPHWDHLLWHADLGEPPRYGTARCAAAIQQVLADPGWPARVAGRMPPEIADQIPLEHFGHIAGLPAETTRIPWDGPPVRILEHRAHATGHAALLIEEPSVLVAGDMLSDVLVPILDFNAADPVEDYLAALALLEAAAGDVNVVIPGHGSIARGDQVPARIALDRAYVEALRNGEDPFDPRIGPAASVSTGVHDRQREQLGRKTPTQ